MKNKTIPSSFKRILIFNVNWLGDVLFSSAAIRNIRLNYPQSFISCVIPSRCYQILKDNPYLDEVIIFDEKDRHKGMVAKLNFISLLKSKRFDAAFLLHRSFSRALICRLAGIMHRIGHYTKKRSFLLTKKIPIPKKDSLHRIDYYLDIIEKAGLRIEDRYLDFFISQSDQAHVEDFLEKNSISKDDFVIALNPGGNWMPKRWPCEYWSKLADELISKTRVKVIITGSASDAKLVNQIKEKMKEVPVAACGALNIKQLGALAKRADIFITGDTGPLHISNAAGCKNIIAIFGPTSKHITGPYPSDNVILVQKDVGCKIPCYKVDCKDNRCMKSVLPDEIFQEAKKLIR